MNEDYVKIKRSIIEGIVSSIKAVLDVNTSLKISELPTIIRTIPKVVLEKYTNSDGVTNSNLQEMIEGVKSDTESIKNSLEFTDSGDADNIIGDIIGG